jgi:hypothetical protein
MRIASSNAGKRAVAGADDAGIIDVVLLQEFSVRRPSITGRAIDLYLEDAAEAGRCGRAGCDDKGH